MKPRSDTPRRPSSPKGRVRPSNGPGQSSQAEAHRLALQYFEPEPDGVYSIEAAARLAGVSRRTILIYCRRNLIRPLGEPSVSGYWFAGHGIQTLRQIEQLRTHCRDELEAVATILSLLDRIREASSA